MLYNSGLSCAALAEEINGKQLQCKIVGSTCIVWYGTYKSILSSLLEANKRRSKSIMEFTAYFYQCVRQP